MKTSIRWNRQEEAKKHKKYVRSISLNDFQWSTIIIFHKHFHSSDIPFGDHENDLHSAQGGMAAKSKNINEKIHHQKTKTKNNKIKIKNDERVDGADTEKNIQKNQCWLHFRDSEG